MQFYEYHLKMFYEMLIIILQTTCKLNKYIYLCSPEIMGYSKLFNII
jgi:hypothetical protein